MAITNIQVISRALREINVINEVQDPSAEQGTQCLDKLNSLMELWKEDSKHVGYHTQTNTTDTCPIPDYAEQAVIHALAVEIAPQYGASISAETAAKLDYYTGVLERKIILEKLDNTEMTHLPEGSGHWGNRYDITKDQ